jgi:universal stress protein E
MDERSMVRIDNILVIVDPTASEHPAVHKAYRLAKQCSSRVELYICETAASREARLAAHLIHDRRETFCADPHPLLEQLAVAGRQQDIDVSMEVEFGDPLHATLLDRTQRTSADLVIKDTHHHSLLQRTLLTNTDWHLIRSCPVPLLLTRPNLWRDPIVIAAAVDPTHANDKPHVLDDRILDWCTYLRTRSAGLLHVLHAFLPLLPEAAAASGAPAMMTVLSSALVGQLQQERTAEVAKLANPHAVAAKHLHVRMGVPMDVLPTLADEIHADILALGAISRSGLQRIFIGGTAEKLLERAPCDLLIVKSPDFSLAMPLY